MTEPKNELAPVQKQEPRPVPLWITELAYLDYVKRYGRAQTLERLNERGGFGQGELIDHLANVARDLAGQVAELERTVAPDFLPILEAAEKLYEVWCAEDDHVDAMTEFIAAWDRMLD